MVMTSKISTSLISSELDADRIDFVRRDGYYSGLFNSSLDYDRFFHFFYLDVRIIDGTKEYFCRPSVKTQWEAEELFFQRFLDYKQIIAHHRVHFFDELLERILLVLLSQNRLEKFLHNIENLLYFENGEDAKGLLVKFSLIVELISRFDDSWIDSKAYEYFLALLEDDQRNKYIYSLFSAQLEKRNLFKSMFKLDNEFWDSENKNIQLFNIFSFEFQNYLIKAKYGIENSVFIEFNIPCIIGETASKVNIGMDNAVIAESYGLLDIFDFLRKKSDVIMPFNIWYILPSNKDETEFRNNLFSFVVDKIIEGADIEMQQVLIW